MERQERRELVLTLRHTRKTRQLQRYGFVHYISHKQKYAILYVDKEDVNETIRKLRRLKLVASVNVSPRYELVEDFSTVLQSLPQPEEPTEGLPLKYRF